MRLVFKIKFAGMTLGLILLLAVSQWQNVHQLDASEDGEVQLMEGKGPFRKLLSLENCTPRAISQFPRDLFSQEQRKNGALVIHVFVAIYMFAAFAFLCDDYFVPSLEVLCDVLQMKPDVAGATFMAAGSSAPELATSIIAVFIAKDDIGLGTVVGSAVYNVMFVISICAIFAGTVVDLNWWPLSRDCLFYSISVAALAWVIVDEHVYWYEAVSFLVLYGLYILLMYFNAPLEKWFTTRFTCCNNRQRFRSYADKEETTTLFSKSQNTNGSVKCDGTTPTANGIDSHDAEQGETYELESVLDLEDSEEEVTTELLESERKKTNLDLNQQEKEPQSVLTPPDKCWKWLIYCPSLPLRLLFYITVPDCRFPRWRRWFFVTFIMSLVWLSVLSYLMVWMITVIGYTIGIADSIMALTIVAFGVSLPDVIASLIVVREGYGDMAVSNAVGSNVFDILICLGVPWLIKTLKTPGSSVEVYSEGLLWATITLLGTVVFLLVATHVNRWRLTKTYGVVLFLVYIVFTVITSLYELNIFGYVHPPECKVDF